VSRRPLTSSHIPRLAGIIDAFTHHGLHGVRILLPRAEAVRDVLSRGLERRGATLDVVPVYRTVKAGPDGLVLKRLLLEGQVDLMTFTDSSTVTGFMELLEKEDLKGLMEGVRVACIGPITAETVERFGLTADIVPEEYTIPALAEAILLIP
jgi:uroporphyrinogen III methyltransferase/synthase